jgi:hypothetical protein
MQRIVVVPVEVGWLVDCDLLETALIFRGGGQAERAARRLAQACALAGRGAVMLVHLRTGEVAGRIRYPPAPGPDSGHFP